MKKVTIIAMFSLSFQLQAISQNTFLYEFKTSLSYEEAYKNSVLAISYSPNYTIKSQDKSLNLILADWVYSAGIACIACEFKFTSDNGATAIKIKFEKTPRCKGSLKRKNTDPVVIKLKELIPDLQGGEITEQKE